MKVMSKMKVKDLKALLESYDDNSEIEIEIYDVITDVCIDSTLDVGLTKNETHPVLNISSGIKNE